MTDDPALRGAAALLGAAVLVLALGVLYAARRGPLLLLAVSGFVALELVAAAYVYFDATRRGREDAHEWAVATVVPAFGPVGLVAYLAVREEGDGADGTGPNGSGKG